MSYQPSPPRDLKKAIGISIPESRDRILGDWLTIVDRNFVPSTPKARPSKGTVVTEMVDVLHNANWEPGRTVKLVSKTPPL